MGRLARIFAGPARGPRLYVSLFTEFQTYPCSDNAWNGDPAANAYYRALKDRYRATLAIFHRRAPNARVSLSWGGWWNTNRDLMTVDHDRPTRQAERWIDANVPPESPILIEDSIWVDLVRTGRPPSRVVWFWKLNRGDPEIDARYPNGWRDMEYVVSTAAVRGSARDLPEVAGALRQGTVVASFGDGGDQVQVLRVHPEHERSP